MLAVHTRTQTQSQTSSMNINRDDIDLLVREPSVAVRVRITDKIAGGYNAGNYSAAETKLANEIFRLLLKDTESKVRLAMAQQLKSNPNAPHDVIWALANDHHEVAAPVLECSPVLTEEDLVAIVKAAREHPKLKAIAKRTSISKQVSHALIEKRDAEVTKLTLANPNAALSETSMESVLEEFSRDHSVMEELVLRGGLPHAFAEKLFSEVSDALRKQLTRRYRLSRHIAEETSAGARETAMLQFVSPWMSQTDIIQMVEQMHRNQRLTDSVIIRSLCIGDLRFFEAAIAKRVGIPVGNARILILDPGPLGFKALYASCGLTPSFFEAIHAMLRIALQETEYGTYRTTDFGARMVGRIIAAGYDKSIPNMDAIVSMIGGTINQHHTTH
jgi:uncharacterized protein (DUF2336 family)